MKKDWRKQHWEELKQLAGNWIGIDKEQGDILAYDTNLIDLISRLTPLGKAYILHYINPFEVYEPRTARFVRLSDTKISAVRFKSLKRKTWRPFQNITLKSDNRIIELSLLVDSGADFSVVDFPIGKSLGFNKTSGEISEFGEGVGSRVEYVMRELEMTIENHTFKAKVAWLLDENINEALLGRENVFDLFDIEFKQAEENIIFKWRGEEEI
jgi:hypothetical protein